MKTQWLTEISKLHIQDLDCCAISAEFHINNYHLNYFFEHKIPAPHWLHGATPSRQAEFLAGRILANIAQEMLGYEAKKIAIGQNGEPLWPDPLCGSISHSKNTVCCVLADKNRYQFVGIDIEKNITIDELEGINRYVLSQSELSLIQRYPLPFLVAATLVFSAKETLFKALYPKVKRYIGFYESTVTSIDVDKNVITIEISSALDLEITKQVDIRYILYDDKVLTVLVSNLASHSANIRLSCN